MMFAGNGETLTWVGAVLYFGALLLVHPRFGAGRAVSRARQRLRFLLRRAT